MRWIPVGLVLGLVLGPLELARAAEPARTHEELDRRIDGLARAADQTLGARLRAQGAPPSVIADVGRIVDATRARLHSVAPTGDVGQRGAVAVVGLGAGLTLDGSTLTGSWREERGGSWRTERSITVDDDAIVQVRKGRGVVVSRRLKRVDRELRLGIVTIPAGSLSVKTERHVDSPIGGGALLGSSSYWVRPDGSHQDMRGPFSAPIARSTRASATGRGGRGTPDRRPARAAAPRPAPR